MRVLVTGGAGYIGSVVVRELVSRGEDVLVLDNLSQGHRSAIPPGVRFYEVDLADKPAVEEIMASGKPDAIVHFASNTLVGESMTHPFKYLGDNITNGLNLIQSAAAHGVKRFVLSSTANLFGEPSPHPIEESAPVRPGSPYGESKFVLERVLHWMDEIYGMRYGLLRYFNACGAAAPDLGEDHDPETHLIPLVLQVALDQREQIVIFGNDYDTLDGTCVRDYIHVSDLASAHLLVLQALEDGSRTYNLGNGQGFSVKEVIECARRVTGHAIPAVIGPRRAGDPAVLVAASDKIRQELGWRPLYTDLEPIIDSAWQWHKRHPDGYPD
ncbi:MAG: UDP-glucose 4-epimerase GalE [Chloroflexota bacterium]